MMPFLSCIAKDTKKKDVENKVLFYLYSNCFFGAKGWAGPMMRFDWCDQWNCAGTCCYLTSCALLLGSYSAPVLISLLYLFLLVPANKKLAREFSAACKTFLQP